MNIAVIDNNVRDANLTKSVVEEYFASKNILVNVFLFNDEVSFVSDYAPIYSLIILEVDLVNKNGITIAKKIRKLDANVLLMFLTNNARFALYGYAVDAFDYVLKPVNYNDVTRRLNKVIEHDCNLTAKKVEITTDGQKRFISIDSICYIEVNSHVLSYHLVNEVICCRGNLNNIEEALKPFGFVKIHKSFIVNLAYVKSVDANSISLNGDTVYLSRGKKKEFIEALNAYTKKYILKGT